MKLIIAIIQDEFINKVVRILMDNKIRTTKLSSTGGFLKAGNTTLLIGTEEEEIDKIVELIRSQCESGQVREEDGKISIGCATLFVLDINQHVKL